MLDPILVIFKSSIIMIDENIQLQSFITFYGDKRPEDYFEPSKRVAFFHIRTIHFDVINVLCIHKVMH
jgi:hypothetical protein